MEAEPGANLYQHLLVGVSLILLISFACCLDVPASPSNEVGRRDLSSFSELSSISSYGGLKKFIMESYYERHESFLDSDFHDFIAQDLPYSSCEVLTHNPDLLRLSVIQRNLIGEGSHRRLSSHIGFNIQSDSTSELPNHLCEVIQIERLPAGVFADPFELEHLSHRGVFDGVTVFGDTNLELPTILSKRSVIEIHKNIGPNVLLNYKNGLDITIELPLHVRYPPLNESGYSQVIFNEPDLFLRCIFEGKKHDRSCLSVFSAEGAELRTGNVVWTVAAGVKGHTGIVYVVTFVSALLSAASIVLTSLCFSDTKYLKLS